MTTPIVDPKGNVNLTQLMLGLRADAKATIQALLNAGIHPRDHGIDPTKYGLRMDGDPTANPFFGGPDKGNQTEQSRMILADRARAIEAMKAVDRRPEEWGLKDTGAQP